MQIDQILIRPGNQSVIVRVTDAVGRRDNLVFDGASNSDVQAVISTYQQQLPSEEEHPAKSEIEQEIAELEYRLTQLKQSIGAD